MTKNRYYFDTSIWIDIYDKRGYNGEIAKKLIQKIIINDDIVLYSDMVFVELKKLGFSEYEINQMLNLAKPDHIQRVHSTKQQADEAKRLAKQREIPFGDVLHAILTRDNDAILISRDRDFEKIKDITRVKLPDDLVYINP